MIANAGKALIPVVALVVEFLIAYPSMALDIAAARKTSGDWGDPVLVAWEFSPASPSRRPFPNNFPSPFNPENFIVDLGDFDINLGMIEGGVTISSLTIGPSGGLTIDQATNLSIVGGGTIANARLIEINGPGGNLVIKDGQVTLTGEGIIELGNATTGISGFKSTGEPPPRLINEDNAITGFGLVGRGRVSITNRSNIVADTAGKKLTLDPDLGTTEFPGDIRNEPGGTLLATSGGILELTAGTFNNDGGTIRAEDNSFVDLAFAADVRGGDLEATGTGSFRTTGSAFLEDVSFLSGILDVQNGRDLTLRGDITNNGEIALGATNMVTRLLIDGTVELAGTGSISFTKVPEDRIHGTNMAQTLINGPAHTIQGSGRLGDGSLLIQNQGTVSANLFGQPISLEPTRGSTLTNTGVLEARNVAILNTLHHTIENTMGKIRVVDEAVVNLNNVTVRGGLLTSTEDSGAPSLTGQFQVLGTTTTFDGSSATLTNDSRVNVLNLATLGLKGTIQNQGTIFLNSDGGPDSNTFLSITGGDVTLQGGGQVLLSNSLSNIITQPAEPTRTLINQDNTIQGSGRIGEMRLALDNRDGGTIRAVGDTLSVDLPHTLTGVVGLRNAGLIEAAEEAMLQVTGGGAVNTGRIRAKGQQSTVIVEGTAVINTGILSAEGGGVTKLRSAPIINSSMGSNGVIAAGSGSRVELSGNTLISGGRLTSSVIGMIRVIDRAGLAGPLTNDAQLEVADGAQLVLIGGRLFTRGDTSVLKQLTNTGTISLNSEESGTELTRLTIEQEIQLRGGGTIKLSDDPGNVIQEGGRVAALINRDNTIRGAGLISGRLALVNSKEGRIIADGMHPLTWQVVEFSESYGDFNEGLIRAEGSGGVELITPGFSSSTNSGRLEVATGSKMKLNGTFINAQGTIQIDGQMNADRVDNRKGGMVVINGRFDGILGSAMGSVSGSGLLNGELVSAGKFRPGQSPGMFTIEGTFEQLSGGQLELEIGGPTAGTMHDQVVVTETATLAGVVVVRQLGGFSAPAGSTFDVITAPMLVDNGFSLAMPSGGLVRPSTLDLGDGTMGLRLTSTDGKRYAQVSGAWETAANWTDGTLPSTDDIAFLPGDPAVDTTVSGPTSDTQVSSLVVGSGDANGSSTIALALDGGTITATHGTTIREDGLLSGDGMIAGALFNGGTASPGASIGQMTIDGGYTQADDGTLQFEVGGLIPGSEYDRLDIGGTAALAGLLEVSFLDLADLQGNSNPFQPALGDSFDVLLAGQIIDDGLTLDVNGLDGGGLSLRMSTVELGLDSNALRLTAVPELEVDFDGDGDVDGEDVDALVGEIVAGTNKSIFDLSADGVVNNADLSQWLRDAATNNGFNAPYLLGDANLDGSVDAGDLNNLALSWRQDDARWSAGDFTVDGMVSPADLNELALNWRQSIPTAAAPKSVPEPTAIILLILGSMATPLRRHRRPSVRFSHVRFSHASNG